MELFDRILGLVWLLLLGGQITLAGGYESVKLEKHSVVGDFAEIRAWSVEGKYKVSDETLLAESELSISKSFDISPPFIVKATVRCSPRPGAQGRMELAVQDDRGGCAIELQHENHVINIFSYRFCGADRLSLWSKSRYKYREGGGPEHLRYMLRQDANYLKNRLKEIENGLKGRTEEWKEWGLGIRGEFFEESVLNGLKETIAQNDAQPLAAERWTELVIEATATGAQLWVDGRAAGSVDGMVLLRPTISLRLPAQGWLRGLHIIVPEEYSADFLPLDLSGYENATALESKVPGPMLPEGLIRVKGVPFWLSRSCDGKDSIDVGRSAPLETGFASNNWDNQFEGLSGLIRQPSRIALLAPKGWYTGLYLLAFAEREPATDPVVSFRFFQGTSVDYSCQVPYWDERTFSPHSKLRTPKLSDFEHRGSIKIGTRGGKDCYLHLVRVPLEPCVMQSWLEKHYFRHFEIEITKGLYFTRGYPDPWNYVSLPGGRKSSVRIVGMTFERSPVEMVVTGDEVGNIVVEPETPCINVLLRNPQPSPRRVSVAVAMQDTAGETSTSSFETEIPPEASVLRKAFIPRGKYGFYRVEVRATGKGVNLVKRTTLGYLPPDTRRATWADSAFGIWSWGAGVGGYAYPTDSEETMRLVWKLGGRWALSPSDPEISRKYGITNSWSFLPDIDRKKVPKEKWEEETKKAMVDGLRKQRERFPEQDLFLCFGEPNLGLKHTFALPGRYYGEPDYQLNEAEKKRFDEMFEHVSLLGKVLQEVRKEYPEFRNVKLTFGNTSPSFHIEFLERGLPKEYIDVFGIDIPYFERMPERQPRAVEGSQLLYLYDYCKENKIENIPIMGTEDMYFPGCPGSLSQREQADYYVRSHLLKFSMGVTREASVGMVFSTSGPYGRCHYGGAGFFEVSPEGGGDGNPRESAVAYATMTRVLDGAKYEKYLPTGSLSTFCLGFTRKFDNQAILALWTIHGKRMCSLSLDKDTKAKATDQWGRSRSVESKGQKLTIEVGSSPVWLEGIKTANITRVEAGPAIHADAPAEGYSILEEFDAPWSPVQEPDKGYEENCFDLPKFKGEMTASIVESTAPPLGKGGAVRGGRSEKGDAPPVTQVGKAIEIALKKPEKERKLAPWYAAFAPPKPIQMPGRPTKLGLYVNGNSGWGRVIPQLTDAKGEIWTFIGPKDAWNADDIRSQSSVNFDGWRYMELELPNNLPNGWNGPALAFWKNEKGDRIVDYPLALTKLYVEQYTHVYCVNEVLPVPDTRITIDKILCTYDDPYEDWHLARNW